MLRGLDLYLQKNCIGSFKCVRNVSVTVRRNKRGTNEIVLVVIRSLEQVPVYLHEIVELFGRLVVAVLQVYLNQRVLPTLVDHLEEEEGGFKRRGYT